MTVNLVTIRGRLGMATRWGHDELAAEYRQDMLAGKVENTIEAMLTDAPPLSADRIERLVEVLRSFSDADDAQTA